MDRPSWVPRGLTRFSFALIVSASFASAQAAGPPQRVIVKYHSTLSADQTARAAGQTLSSAGKSFGVAMSTVRTSASGAQVVRLGSPLPEKELKLLIETIAADPNVAYAEEDVLLQPMALPNDPQLAQQWDFIDTTAGINAPAAWNISTGKGVTVAVIDSGYRPHADLVANIVGGYDFISEPFVGNDGDARDADAQDPGSWSEEGQCGAARPSNWHGTHVAGTIAASTNNGIGVAGVAYNARILPLRVLGRCGGYTSDIADAIIWAAGGEVPDVPTNAYPARVINISLGGQAVCGMAWQNAIASARARGSVIVVASGNANDYSLFYVPTSCFGVVVTAATDLRGGRAFYSNFGGGFIDVSAPGGDPRPGPTSAILSLSNDGTTVPGNDSYAYYAGTSQAAPHVAGVAALMLAVNPLLTPDQVEKLLADTARRFPARCSQCGPGIVDAAAAVSAARRR